MNKQDKILVGKIVAPQGLRGELRVQTFTANPLDFQKFKVQSSKFKDNEFHIIRKLNPSSEMIIAKIDGINDRNAAESLRGTELYIDRDSLPPAGADEYYVADLIGSSVYGNGKKGVVVAVHNFGAGDILELDNGDMISFVGASVDIKNKKIEF